MTNQRVITRAGYEELKAELDRLINEDLKRITERLEQLHGEVTGEEDTDLFHAMADKNYVDERIENLRNVLANSVIIDEDPDPETASPGDNVVVKDMDTGEQETFRLLGSDEVAHGLDGVSIESPVGRALLGKRIGEEVEVAIPDGKVHYKIVAFEG